MELISDNHPKVINPNNYLDFITAGKALFTAKSLRTGRHFTYRLSIPKGKSPDNTNVIFVKVLSGPDNEHSYVYIGYLKKIHDTWVYYTGSKNATRDAQSNQVFSFIIRLATNKRSHPEMVLWHHSRCCRCRRTLTDPVSIELGIGPECRKH